MERKQANITNGSSSDYLDEFGDFTDYWAAYAWATDDYLKSLSESGSMRLTELVRAAYLAGAIDGPRAFTATAWAVRGVRC